MPQAKRRLFKHSKSQAESVKEIKVVEKLQKGRVEFKKTERTSRKKKEDIKERPHFPSISRSIPEVFNGFPANPSKFSLKMVFLGVLIVLGVAWNVWVGVGLYKSFVGWSRLLLARGKLYGQMATWENIAQKYPNYRDAYVEGAILAYRLGDKEKEAYFLKNLEILDPNFPLTKSLQQLINLQNER